MLQVLQILHSQLWTNNFNVILQVGSVIIVRTIIRHRHGGAGGIVGKVQGIVTHSHLAQSGAVKQLFADSVTDNGLSALAAVHSMQKSTMGLAQIYRSW